MSVYTKLVEVGAEIDSHESDLYVKHTTEVMNVLREVKGWNSWVRFYDREGAPWIEIPFAYDPWWSQRQKGAKP